MKTTLTLLLAAIGFLTTLPKTSAQSQPGIVLKLDGIPGDSQVANHQQEIDLSSLQFGVSQTGIREAGGKASARRSSLSTITVTKQADKASPKLFLACATGAHIDQAVLTFIESTPTPLEYLTITLSDVFISSYSVSSGGDRPSEAASLSFSKIEYRYVGRDPMGQPLPPVVVVFDVAKNKQVLQPE